MENLIQSLLDLPFNSKTHVKELNNKLDEILKYLIQNGHMYEAEQIENVIQEYNTKESDEYISEYEDINEYEEGRFDACKTAVAEILYYIKDI